MMMMLIIYHQKIKQSNWRQIRSNIPRNDVAIAATATLGDRVNVYLSSFSSVRNTLAYHLFLYPVSTGILQRRSEIAARLKSK